MNGSAPASIDFSKPFGFVFKDPAWLKKVALGGVAVLACCFLVGIPLVMGYLKRVFLTLVENLEAPLPEWNFGDDFQKGLPAAGAYFCYILPMVVVCMVLSKISCVGPLLGFVLELAVSVLMPAVIMNVFLKDDFNAAFDFNWIQSFIKANLKNYLMAVVLSFVASLVAGFGIIACVVGMFLTFFWAGLVSMHGWAQVYRIAMATGTAAPPPLSVPPAPPAGVA